MDPVHNGHAVRFSLATDMQEDVVILRLKGELDVVSVSSVRARVKEVVSLITPPRLVLDVEQLQFCDSSGLSALLAARKQTQAAGGKLALSGVNGRLARLLRMTGLDSAFSSYSTAKAAVESFSSP